MRSHPFGGSTIPFSFQGFCIFNLLKKIPRVEVALAIVPPAKGEGGKPRAVAGCAHANNGKERKR